MFNGDSCSDWDPMAMKEAEGFSLFSISYIYMDNLSYYVGWPLIPQPKTIEDRTYSTWWFYPLAMGLTDIVPFLWLQPPPPATTLLVILHSESFHVGNL